MYFDNLYNKLLKSCIMHKLVLCKIYKRDEKLVSAMKMITK